MVDPRGSGLLFFMFIRPQPYTSVWELNGWGVRVGASGAVRPLFPGSEHLISTTMFAVRQFASSAENIANLLSSLK
jgi:hypothetical protein